MLDAYRREILSDAELGLGTAVHVNAYKIAGLIPGSLSLILADHLSWRTGVLRHRLVHAARHRNDSDGQGARDLGQRARGPCGRR